MQKQRHIQWSNDFDIDNLESAGCWATMEELLSVIPFHIRKYQDILNNCRNYNDTVRPAEISFATKYIATYLFIKVKGTRPMTYQYLTLDMIKQARRMEATLTKNGSRLQAITDLILWLLINKVDT